jgi:hypothetical protein
MVVKGRAEFTSEARTAYVGGHLDMTGSQFAFLRARGDERSRREEPAWLQRRFRSLQPAPPPPDAEQRGTWTLERAQVGQLTFQEPFPVTNMRGMHASMLEVLDKNGNESRERGLLLHLLQKNHPFSMEPYALAERLLRTQGLRHEADLLHADSQRMWRRKADPRPPWFTRFGHWLAGALFGYGIGWGRTLGMGLALWLLAFVVASDPGNWEASASRPAGLAPVDELVSCSEAFLKAGEIAIPLISLGPKEPIGQPKLREQGATQVSGLCWPRFLKTQATREVAITPNLLAGIIALLGWIVWPGFLISMSRYLRRE